MSRNGDFTMIITSDPQYVWLPKDDTESGLAKEPVVEVTKSNGKTLAKNYVNTIKITIGSKGLPPPLAIIINGDLVAFNNCGVSRDLEGFKKHFYKPYTDYFDRDFVFLGLGNHDYINNDGRTAFNSGALAMLDFVLNETRNPRNHSSVSPIDIKDDKHTLYTIHTGSLSYYTCLWGCAFIQLHEGPGFSSKISGEFETLYDITESTEWLEKTLDTINKSDKIHSIFINLHEVSNNYDSIAILEKIFDSDNAKKVKAVFSGHFHKDYGRRNNIGDIPHFNSGSASQGTFLSLVGYDEKKEFEISVWKNEDIMRQANAIMIDGPYLLYYDKNAKPRIVLKTGKLKLVKVNKADESEKIAGVKFEIWRADNHSLVESVTTGQDGTVNINSLRIGDYYAVEVQCPNKFKPDYTCKYFTVEYEKETLLTVYNEPIT